MMPDMAINLNSLNIKYGSAIASYEYYSKWSKEDLAIRKNELSECIRYDQRNNYGEDEWVKKQSNIVEDLLNG